MSYTRTALIVTLLVALAGCGGEQPVPTLLEAANATYSGVYEQPFTLTDGVYEGAPFVEGGASRPRVILVDNIHVVADLNGDGSSETVVLLAESSGGSGTTSYLAVLGGRDGDIVNLGTAPLGDRVQIRRLTVDQGRVVADVIQQGPEDAACCPSQKATRTWMLDGDGVTEGEVRITGTLSLKDLEGVTWMLTHIGIDLPIVEHLDVTLTVDGNKIGGSGGCNDYSTEITETAAGEVSVAAIATTRKMCADPVGETEYHFLKALGGVQSYGFLAGRLMLTCKVDDDYIALLFVPRSGD